jgi:hypothetical protein
MLPNLTRNYPLTVTKLLLLCAAWLVAAGAWAQDPTHRTWRLSGIYIGEVTGQIDPAYKPNVKQFLTVRSATADGGMADIAVMNNTRGVLFRQRFTWRFPQDIRTIRSVATPHVDMPYQVQYALEGERPTTNGNLIYFHGVGAGAKLLERVYTREHLNTSKMGVQGIYTNSSAHNSVITIGTREPTSAIGRFGIGHSNAYAGAEYASFWFTINLSNNEPGGTQIYEIHYVFTSDRTPPGALPRQEQLPPGIVIHQPTSGLDTPPSPPRPPIPATPSTPPGPPAPPAQPPANLPPQGPPPVSPIPPQQPPPAQGVGFPAPMINGVAVDWCASWARDCGQGGADQFCRTQGYARAQSWQHVLVNHTFVIGSNQHCQGAGSCGALRNVVCAVASTATPPQPPVTPPPQVQPPVAPVPPQLPPSGHTPPPAPSASFPAPTINGVAVDWCATWATNCGQGGADQFCRTQGYTRAQSWQHALINHTFVIGSNQHCQGAGSCGALRNVVCTGGATAPPAQAQPPVIVPGQPGHTPPLAQGASFPAPMINGIAVDWCATWARDCGQGGADQFCRTQGYARAARWQHALVNHTYVIGSQQHCQVAGSCGALRNVDCTR